MNVAPAQAISDSFVSTWLFPFLKYRHRKFQVLIFASLKEQYVIRLISHEYMLTKTSLWQCLVLAFACVGGEWTNVNDFSDSLPNCEPRSPRATKEILATLMLSPTLIAFMSYVDCIPPA
jgi:hypothetical protein